MLSTKEREEIISLIKQQVVPAMGCTEPMCVALCVAKATEELGCLPDRIEVHLSANLLKNAMGVGIPGTGMIGLPIAIALGAIIGKSEYKLQVLKDLTPEVLEQGKKYIAEGRINIQLKEDITEKLYVEAIVNAECRMLDAELKSMRSARAIIAGSHTNFVAPHPPKGESSIGPTDENCALKTNKNLPLWGNEGASLSLRLVYDFATTAPLSEISFILEAKELNMNAAKESVHGNYGHCLGKTIERPMSHGIFGNSIFSHIISKTALACDARMGGAMVPVMSNSGSGNQGICATNPVVVYAQENQNTEEELIRALTLSHLTAIYIKQSLGTLSALCGCVVASTGASCGITYLMGGDYDRICFAVNNMIANLTGMICDGAKPSCSLKIASGVSTALLSALLAMEGKHVTSAEGIVDNDVDKTIHNLTSIGAKAMDDTDRMVLDIMTSK
ncbi:MAG: L-serine ammonia-lyase, iron-sulfur-dependent, subunit alpha [Bacteroidaceae bacterium]|nr:L-serine ammonia-lyase, iron-sulfur-dependent, subunit alpha [Bacteroidaceae bacterium]